MVASVLTVESASVRGQSGSSWLRLPDFSLTGGESLAVVGLAGTGKTSIAHALAGLPFRSSFKARISFASGGSCSETRPDLPVFIAFVPNRPRLMFSGLRSTLREEMLLTLQFLNRPTCEAKAAVSFWANAFQVPQLLDRDLGSLSGGETALGALAVALVKSPSVVVLDGIYDFLFPETRQLVRQVLSRLVREGALLVETHAQPPEWLPEFDKCLMLSHSDASLVKPTETSQVNNCLPSYFMTPVARNMSAILHEHANTDTPPEIPATVNAAVRIINRMHPKHTNRLLELLQTATTESPQTPHERPALSAGALCFSYSSGGFHLGPTTFEISPREIVALLGPNGSGKTTLLKAIACLLEPLTGTLAIRPSPTQPPALPPPRSRKHLWAKSVIYCFQDPDDQLYLPTVREELLSISLSIGSSPSKAEIIEIMHQLGLSQLLDASPFDLPLSLRRLTALGAALIARPPVLLLDEPTAGLDLLQVKALQILIRNYAANGGSCIFVSHDPEFTSDLAHRAILLSHGQIEITAPLAAMRQCLPNESLSALARIALSLQSSSQTPAQSFQLLTGHKQ